MTTRDTAAEPRTAAGHPWAGTDDGHNCETCIAADDHFHKCDRLAHAFAEVMAKANAESKRVATEKLRRHGSIAGPGFRPAIEAEAASGPALTAEALAEALCGARHVSGQWLIAPEAHRRKHLAEAAAILARLAPAAVEKEPTDG